MSIKAKRLAVIFIMCASIVVMVAGVLLVSSTNIAPGDVAAEIIQNLYDPTSQDVQKLIEMKKDGLSVFVSSASHKSLYQSLGYVVVNENIGLVLDASSPRVPADFGRAVTLLEHKKEKRFVYTHKAAEIAEYTKDGKFVNRGVAFKLYPPNLNSNEDSLNLRPVYLLQRDKEYRFETSISAVNNFINKGGTNTGMYGNVLDGSVLSLNWNSKYSADGLTKVNTSRRVNTDIVITRVEAVITDFVSTDLWSDICLYQSRTESNYEYVTGGYSELVCGHADMYTISGNTLYWRYNLKDTPLLVTSGTDLACLSVLKGRKANLAGTRYHCRVEYERLTPGRDAYRILRLPYADQASINRNIPAVDYRSKTDSPISVGGFSYFMSFFGENAGKNATPCITWSDNNGNVKQRKCLATQTRSVNQNYVTSDKVTTVNWNLADKDRLSATCSSSTDAVDCALFVFAKVPAHQIGIKGITFRDPGNINRNMLTTYCQQNVDRMTPHTFYCSPSATVSCSNQVKINNCINRLVPKL